jgi:uncharacterized protein YmfQ (DUF2313 family)
MKRVILFIPLVVGMLAVSVPVPGADRPANQSRYSDRDRMSSWSQGKNQLEQALKIGESKDFYRPAIEKQGFRITAVNYDKPDYLEYEVVKGDQSYEVQIDFDKNSNKSSKVDVDRNLWRAEATDRALEARDKQQVSRSKDLPKGDPRYSDRDRKESWTKAENELEQALKTGEDKNFYRRELEKMGWKITSVNYDKADYIEYEIVKGDHTYEVQIDFDKNSHKATKVDVAANMWRADATKRAMQNNAATKTSK